MRGVIKYANLASVEGSDIAQTGNVTSPYHESLNSSKHDDISN